MPSLARLSSRLSQHAAMAKASVPIRSSRTRLSRWPGLVSCSRGRQIAVNPHSEAETVRFNERTLTRGPNTPKTLFRSTKCGTPSTRPAPISRALPTSSIYKKAGRFPGGIELLLPSIPTSSQNHACHYFRASATDFRPYDYSQRQSMPASTSVPLPEPYKPMLIPQSRFNASWRDRTRAPFVTRPVPGAPRRAYPLRHPATQ